MSEKNTKIEMRFRPSDADQFGEHTQLIHPEERREWQWVLPTRYINRKLPVCVKMCGNGIWGKGVRIERKKSNLFALEMVTRGAIDFVQNNRTYIVGPGEIMILHHGGDHSYGTAECGFAHKRSVILRGDALQSLVSQMDLLEHDVFKPRDAFAFIRFQKAAARLFETRPPDFVKRLSALAYEIFLFAGHEIETPQYPPAIQATINFMHARLTGQPSLADMAQAAGLSVPRFAHVFRNCTGVAPMEYFRRMKIELACQMLDSTSARIKEIAIRLGYGDSVYFSQMFARETGMSPREYRKR